MTPDACARVIMIVDDDVAIGESLTEILTDHDYRPITAANGREAIEHLKTAAQKPCVILLDIMMPVMDGWEFRALQQEDPDLRAIPVIVLTAHANLDETATGMRAQGCLKKPATVGALLSAVERFCPGVPT